VRPPLFAKGKLYGQINNSAPEVVFLPLASEQPAAAESVDRAAPDWAGEFPRSSRKRPTLHVEAFAISSRRSMLDNCLHSGYASVQPAILTSAQRGILPELVLSVAGRRGPLGMALGANVH
jgi:hypothetical protein